MTLNRKHIYSVTCYLALLVATILLAYFRMSIIVAPHNGIYPAVLSTAIMTMLCVPCVYLCTRCIVSKLVARILATFVWSLAIFPSPLLFERGFDFTKPYQYPVGSLVFSLPAWLIPLGLLVVSGLVNYSYFMFVERRCISRSRLSAAIALALVLSACLVQVSFRVGKYSPSCVLRGVHKNPKIDRAPIFGINNEDTDWTRHLQPSAIFRGNPWNWGFHIIVCNRPTGYYFYSLFSDYFHPYYSALIVNTSFYILFVLIIYRLVCMATCSYSIAVASALFAASNFAVLLRTVTTKLYFHYSLLLACVYIGSYIGIYRPRQIGLCLIYLYACLICTAALAYDPVPVVLLVSIHCLFSIYYNGKQTLNRHLSVIGRALFIILLIVLSASLWNYNIPEDCRVPLMNEVMVDIPRAIDFKMSGFIYFVRTNPWHAFQLLDSTLYWILTPNNDYWQCLSLLWIMSFAALVPRYLSRKWCIGLYALLISNMLLYVLMSVVLSYPPAARSAYVFMNRFRSSHQFLSLYVIAQVFMLLYLLRAIGLTSGVSHRITLFVLAVIIFALSFATTYWL